MSEIATFGAGNGCQKVARGAGSERKAQAACRNGNHAGGHLLSRGRISPEISAEARRSELPLLSCDPFSQMRKTEPNCLVFFRCAASCSQLQEVAERVGYSPSRFGHPTMFSATCMETASTLTI